MIANGDYEKHLVPPEVAQAQQQGERFYPRELAALVHEEAGMLVKRAISETLAKDENIVIDGTLSKQDAADRLLKQLQRAGYQVDVVSVDGPKGATARLPVFRSGGCGSLMALC
jgi:hypothetical protein